MSKTERDHSLVGKRVTVRIGGVQKAKGTVSHVAHSSRFGPMVHLKNLPDVGWQLRHCGVETGPSWLAILEGGMKVRVDGASESDAREAVHARWARPIQSISAEG